jgi:hypothetical protein
MSDAANHSANETLRDGRTVEIRAQRSHDREGMQAAIARSSSGSLYRRFFSVSREFSDNQTEYFLDIDFTCLFGVCRQQRRLANDRWRRAYVVFQPVKPKSRSRSSTRIYADTQTTNRYPDAEVNRIRRWIGCSGRAFIWNDTLKRSTSLCATATGAANTFHSTTSEQGGVVSEPS